MLSPQDFSDLVGSIYDCAIEPARWERTLAEIVTALSCEAGILSLNDLREDRLLIDKNVGWSAATLERRQKHLPEIHARLKEWFARHPPDDEAFVASRYLRPEYLSSSRYVMDCLQPAGIVDVLHQPLMRTPTRFSELVLARHHRHGLVTNREIATVKLLLPHLRRAVTVSNVLDVHAVARPQLAQALDALRHGVLLTDSESTILYANQAAEDMLRGENAALSGAGGILCAREAATAHELREAIRLTARDETRLKREGLAVVLPHKNDYVCGGGGYDFGRAGAADERQRITRDGGTFRHGDDLRRPSAGRRLESDRDGKTALSAPPLRTDARGSPRRAVVPQCQKPPRHGGGSRHRGNHGAFAPQPHLRQNRGQASDRAHPAPHARYLLSVMAARLSAPPWQRKY